VHSLTRGVEVARITARDIDDIYDARRTFETAGLLALLAQPPVDVSWLRAATTRMSEAAVAGNGRAALEADMAFHLAIVAAAGVRRLTSAARGALLELRLVLSVADRAADDLPALVAAHDALVDVFQAGDRDAARRALLAHLTDGEAVARAAAPAATDP
jgi:DNA-binding GntR family transcriptional regulator